MLPLGSALTLLSMATIWIVGVRLRKIRGVPSLLESLAEKVYGKQQNASVDRASGRHVSNLNHMGRMLRSNT